MGWAGGLVWFPSKHRWTPKKQTSAPYKMHAPSLFPGPKPNHLISLCRKKLLAWKYVLRVHVQLSPGNPARFQYPPLHCLKWTQNSVMKWLVPTSFCKECWLLQNDSPKTRFLQNGMVDQKKNPYKMPPFVTKMPLEWNMGQAIS